MEKPILFSTEMVKAILEGRKTQTRRIIKESYNGCLTNGGPHPCPNEPVVMIPGEVVQSPIEGEPDIVIDGEKVHAHFFCSTMDKVAYCPYGKIGDILWVRECSAITYSSFKTKRTVWYKADDPIIPERVSFRWKPSIHMPKTAARIWLEITDIRVERLQDISDKDVFAEGIQSVVNAGQVDDGTVRGAFRALWEKINDPESWNESPWVWVVSFKVLSTTGRPKTTPHECNIQLNQSNKI